MLWLTWFVFLSVAGVSAQQSRQNLEAQRKRALQEIEETSRYLRETAQNREQSVEKLNLLHAQELQFQQLIGNMDAEIALADRQIDETQADVSRLSREVEKMKAEYARLVFQAYKNRGRYNKLVYVLSAKDFNEAYRRLKYFQQYGEHRKKQVGEITAKQEELRTVIELLTVRKAEKEKLLAEQRVESRKLEAVKVERNAELNSLKSQERKLRSQLAAQQRKAQRLQSEIERMITADAKKRNTTAGRIYDKLTPDERLMSSNFKGNKGRLPWPTEKGTITGYFGVNPHPLFKGIRLNNTGIDITTVGEASVRAVFDGEVTNISGIPGYNIVVLVRHGNYITVYSNLVDVTVKQGAKVKVKETIGKVYTRKGAKTAILHFEIWEELNKLNPEQWIGKD